MIYNYHTHTERCHHAVNSDKEYIEQAIKAGIKYLGFSDHAPFMFPDGHESSYRVSVDWADEYIGTIRSLADKYKDRIQISVGFEMEYYPSYFEDMLSLARKVGADYLILGQHFISDEWPEGVGSLTYTEDPEKLRQYVDNVISAIKSGVFTYVAHPDMINFQGDDNLYHSEITRLCQAAKEFNVPLEINLLGVRYNRIYPSDRFFAIAGEVGAPVTFGIDAHEAANLSNKEQVITAVNLVQKYNLNYIGMPTLKSIY